MAKMLSLRVSDEEYAQLNERANLEGRTLSNYIRFYLFSGAGIPEDMAANAVVRRLNPYRSTADEETQLSAQQARAKQAGIDQILKGVNRKPKS